MTCRYQRVTPRLLPAGAAVAGWVIFLPLEERVLSTARSESGFKSACLKKGEVPTNSFRLSIQRAAEFSGAAGEFRCQSLN